MEIIFITSIAIIAYTYIGYPLLLMVFSTLFRNPVKKLAKDFYPMVSIIVTAYNEEKNIEAKVANLLGLDYPRDKMEIIVGSDGSTDETYRIIKSLAEANKIRYTVSFQRIGKPAMINKMAKDARGEIFIFADACQKFDCSAVKELVKCFADATVGAVSGELIIQDKDTGAGCGIGSGYEKLLMKMESNIGSMLGATGAIYAIRKDLFRYLPENIILDDVFTPMNAIMLNKRAVFEPAARVYGVVSEKTENEFAINVRALAGEFQILTLFSEALHPFKSPIAFQLFSHKFLRLFVFYLLVLTLVSNIFLLNKGAIFVLALFLQAIFYGIAFLGYLLDKSKVRSGGALRLFFVPYEFCALSLAAVAAMCEKK